MTLEEVINILPADILDAIYVELCQSEEMRDILLSLEANAKTE